VAHLTFQQPAPRWQRTCGSAEARRAKEQVEHAVQQHAAAGGAYARQLKAWLKSLECDGRAAFLAAPPMRWAAPLRGAELQFAVRRLLRLELPGLAGHKCSCGALLDPHGDHADTCENQNGERHRRHTHVNEKGVVAPARQAKLSTSIETVALTEDTNGRPADTCLESGHGFGDNVKVCLDVVGSGSCADNYVDNAARWAGGAMHRAVDKKLRKARLLNAANGADLIVVPMAFESLGGLHPNWRIMYETWAERWSSQGPGRDERVQAALVRGWVARTSVAIQRAQFRLVSKMRVLAREESYHGDEPHEWRAPDLDDVDARRAVLPSGG
jgi:hypothetical protein